MTKDREYIEIAFPIAGFDPDRLSAEMHGLACQGIQELAEQWIVYFPPDGFPERMDDLMTILKRLNPEFAPEDLRYEKRPVKDWNAEWRKHFQPLEVLPGWWIRAPWHEVDREPEGCCIIIDPQMAFGTGHHETTRLMLQALQRTAVGDRTVLDLGTGSGILAIAARQCGARTVLAVDIDPDAIANAAHNLALNNIDRVETVVGDIAAAGEQCFDYILANIQFDVLQHLPLRFYQLLESGGRAVISGILRPDVSRLSYLYKHAGFQVEEAMYLNEWAAVIYRKPAPER